MPSERPSTAPPDAGHLKPVVLLFFANDYHGAHLAELQREITEVEDALLDHVEERPYRVVKQDFARIGHIFDHLATYNDRVVVFHYGGHARPDALRLAGEEGRPTDAYMEGLAARLGDLPSLSLVFLNGCNTKAQAAWIHESSRAVVIATDAAIEDGVAWRFAARLYHDLATGRTIAEAYRSAVARARALRPWPAPLREVSPHDPGRTREHRRVDTRVTAVARRVVAAARTRMLGPAGDADDDAGSAWPWAIYTHPDAPESVHWRLVGEPRSPPTPTRWGLIVGVGLVVAALVIAALVVAAGAWPPPPVADAGPPPDAGPPADATPSPDASPPAPVPMDAGRAAPAPPADAAPRPADAARALAPWDQLTRALADETGDEGGGAPLDLDALLGELAGPAWTGEPSTRLERFGLLLAEIDARPGDRRAERTRLRLRTTLRSIWGRPDAAPLVEVAARAVQVRGASGPRTAQTARFGLAPRAVTVGELRRLVPDYRPDLAAGEAARGLSWVAARAYAEWAGARLPTREEWQAAVDACRASARPEAHCASLADGVGDWVADPGADPATRIARDSDEQLEARLDEAHPFTVLRLAGDAPPRAAPAPPSKASLVSRLARQLKACQCAGAGATIKLLDRHYETPRALFNDFEYDCRSAYGSCR